MYAKKIDALKRSIQKKTKEHDDLVNNLSVFKDSCEKLKNNKSKLVKNLNNYYNTIPYNLEKEILRNSRSYYDGLGNKIAFLNTKKSDTISETKSAEEIKSLFTACINAAQKFVDNYEDLKRESIELRNTIFPKDDFGVLINRVKVDPTYPNCWPSLLELHKSIISSYIGSGSSLDSLDNYQERIRGLYEQVGSDKRLLDDLKKKERKYRKSARDRALIASHNKKSRNLSPSVKKTLKVTRYCPYCFELLGNDYHADHIYPVSKGGLTVPQNMVNICKKCNSRKGSHTLNYFIKKYSLNRDKIEATLAKLGKEY